MANSRQIENRKILRILSSVIEDNPDWRFGQILVNLNIANFYGPNDIFFEEPDETLGRIHDVIGFENIKELTKETENENGN